MTAKPFGMIAAVLALATLSACAYRGGDIGDPITRKFHWFSFVEGEDIRATCQPGTPDRFRLVYNGIYDEQLRIYELDALRRLLVVRVARPGDSGRLSSDDLLAPWRAAEEKVPLDEAAYAGLLSAFDAGGMFQPPPVGLELPSRSYFWTAALCKDGRYGFTAWKPPAADFDTLAFARTLFALDPTGIPVNEPKPVRFDPQWEDQARRLQVVTFTLKVGQTGLVH